MVEIAKMTGYFVSRSQQIPVSRSLISSASLLRECSEMLKSIHRCWYRVQNAGIVFGLLSPFLPFLPQLSSFPPVPSVFHCFLVSNSFLSPDTILLSQRHTFLLLAVLPRLCKQLFLNEIAVSIQDDQGSL